MNLILDSKETYVLLIGVNEYKNDDYENVTLAENNIVALKKLFLNHNIFGGIPESQVICLINEDNNIILEEIEKVSNASRDTIIIYYVGHGERLKGKKLYLTANNSKRSLLRTTGIEFKIINDIINDSQAKKRFIILDSCYSGLAALSGGEEFFPKTELKNMNGTYIITSSPSNQKSYYDPKAKYTHFTDELINILSNGLPNESPFLEMTEIFQTLKSTLSNKGLPLPKQKNTIDTDKIYFANNFIFNEYSNSVRKFDALFSKGDLEAAKKGYNELLNKHKNLPKTNIVKRIHSISLLKDSDKLYKENKFGDAYEKINQGLENIQQLGIQSNESYNLKKHFYEKIISMEKSRREELVKEIKPNLKTEIEEDFLKNPEIVSNKIRKKFETEYKYKIKTEKKEIFKQLKSELEEKYRQSGNFIERDEILHVSANPSGTARLRLDIEIRELANVLRGSDFRLITSMATRLEDLEDLFLETNPKFILFSMHSQPNELIFEGNEEKNKTVNSEKIAQFLSVLTENVKCIILNGSYTSETAYYLSQQADYVIGMKGAIGDNACIAFLKSFFRSYKKKPLIEFAYEFAVKAVEVAHSIGDVNLYKKGDFDKDVWENM